MSHCKDVKWTEWTCDLQTFVKKFSNNLPLIIKVTEGFCGIDEQDDYTFATDDEYRLTHLNKQCRVIVKDAFGRHLSIPVDHPLKFQKVVYDDDEPTKPFKPLSELLDILDEEDEIVAAEGDNVNFWIGIDKKMGISLGKLEFVNEYEERYLVGNAIIEGVPVEEPIVIPAFVSIRIALAEGMENDSLEDFDDMKCQLAKLSQNFQNEKAAGNSEIMLFEGKISDYRDYDYVRPSHYVRFNQTSLPEPTQHSIHKVEAKQTKKVQLHHNMYTKSKTGSPPLSQMTLTTRCPKNMERRPLPPIPTSSYVSGKSIQTKMKTDNQMSSVSSPALPPRNPRPEKAANRTNLAMPQEIHHDYENKVIPVKPTVFSHVISVPPSLVTEPLNSAEDQEQDDYETPVGIVRQQPAQRTEPHTQNDDLYDLVDADEQAQVTAPSKPLARSKSAADVPPQVTGPSKPPTRSKSSASALHLNNTIKEDTEIERSVCHESGVATKEQKYTTQSKPVPVTQDTSSDANKASSEHIVLFSVEQVGELLKELKLQQYTDNFKENDIDGEMLTELTEEDLVNDFNFKRFQALKLLKYVKGWRPNLT